MLLTIKKYWLLVFSAFVLAFVGFFLFPSYCKPIETNKDITTTNNPHILALEQEFQALSKNIFLELHETFSDLENILLPEKVCNYEHLVQSKENLEKSLSKLNESQSRLKAAASQFEAQVQSYHFTDNSLQETFLSDFTEDKNKSDALMESYFHIERSSILKFNELVSFLSKVHGFYRISEGHLVFQSEENLKTFNQLIQEISDLGQEEGKIIKQMQEHLEPSFWEK